MIATKLRIGQPWPRKRWILIIQVEFVYFLVHFSCFKGNVSVSFGGIALKRCTDYSYHEGYNAWLKCMYRFGIYALISFFFIIIRGRDKDLCFRIHSGLRQGVLSCYFISHWLYSCNFVNVCSLKTSLRRNCKPSDLNLVFCPN